jgi:hypothetical protein
MGSDGNIVAEKAGVVELGCGGVPDSPSSNCGPVTVKLYP